MKSKINFSVVTVIIIGILLSFFRLSNVNDKEISWDVLGYYLPLPATFIHSDPMLEDISWLEEINDEKDLSGTLYMISKNETGETMYFFLFGMSFFYSIFFFIGHGTAHMFDYPVNGFSEPYVYAAVTGAIIYTIIGLIYFRKILLHYFSDKIAALIIILTAIGTNYVHELSLKNLETVNILFMLSCMIFWFTIKWHENHRKSDMIRIAIVVGLMTLVKPSEIIIALVPILWNIHSFQSLKSKAILFGEHWKQLLLAIIIGLIVLSPQLIYWTIKTGFPNYDSYKNPGVGLDLLSPHIIEILFSYRKGWLVYTPLILFFLAGIPLIWKFNKKIFLASIGYFLISFYIISSWSEWWYGASYSIRPLITTYPFLAIGLGYLIVYLKNKNIGLKITVATLMFCFVMLNQFQWWQLKNYILDPYRTTKDYYWSIFLKTEIDKENDKYKSVFRDFSGNYTFNNQKEYSSKILLAKDFESETKVNINRDENGNNFFSINSNQDFALTESKQYNSITNEDHVWIKISLKIRSAMEIKKNKSPRFVISMDRKEGNYGYHAVDIPLTNEWEERTFYYLTPAIRDQRDQLKYYIWNSASANFDIDDFVISYFEKK